MRNLVLLFAVAKDGKFGCSKGLPWKCPSDMALFKRLTMGGTIVMGSKTRTSMGDYDLPDRKTVVVSRSGTSLDEALSPVNEPLWIVGGTEIFKTVIRDYHPRIAAVCYNIIGDRYLKSYDDTESDVYFDYTPTEHTIRLDNGDDTTTIVDLMRCFPFNDHPTVDRDYLSTLTDIIRNGRLRTTRNGPVVSSFDDYVIRTRPDDGYPMLQCKRVWHKGVVEELAFFLDGKTDTRELEERGVKIWSHDTRDTDGEMGPMYGYQWRNYGGTGLDQIRRLIDGIKNDPNGRRHLLTTYHAGDAPKGVLYPCHGIVTQFYVDDDTLHLKTFQRSADLFLGVPFNLTSYHELLAYVAGKTGLKTGKTSTYYGDIHVYQAHFPAAVETLLRASASVPFRVDRDDLKTYRDRTRIINAPFC